METPPLPPEPTPIVPGSNDRQWILITHLIALTGLLVPFGNILGPLIIWLLKKQEIPVVDSTGRAVLNFQISWSIYIFVAGLSMWLCIGVVLFPAVVLAWLIFLIIGVVKASNGEPYTFPLTIKFL